MQARTGGEAVSAKDAAVRLTVGGSCGARARGSRERAAEIGDDVLGALESDAQPHDVVARACGDALLVEELAVRRARGVEDERARVFFYVPSLRRR